MLANKIREADVSASGDSMTNNSKDFTNRGELNEKKSPPVEKLCDNPDKKRLSFEEALRRTQVKHAEIIQALESN